MISIEFSHILGNEQINSYHKESFELFFQLQKENINNKGCIFIDNYNFDFNESSLNQFDFISNDILVYKELDIQIYADTVIELLGFSNIQNEPILKYKNILIKKNNKYTCSFLTTSWYLYRLGFLSENIKYDSIINILPSNFKNVEKNALKLLKKINPLLQKKVQSIFIDCPEYINLNYENKK